MVGEGARGGDHEERRARKNAVVSLDGRAALQGMACS